VKIPAGDAHFDLIAIDLWRLEAPIFNIAAQPCNRVQLARQRGDPAWVFVIQLMVMNAEPINESIPHSPPSLLQQNIPTHPSESVMLNRFPVLRTSPSQPTSFPRIAQR
jgi:hypothetical protein